MTPMTEYLIRLVYLVIIQIKEIRTTGWWTVIFSFVIPFGVIIYSYLSGHTQSPEEAAFILSGSLTISIMSNSLIMTTQRLSYLKNHGGFSYYFSLPISKEQLIVSIIGAYSLVSLPAYILLFLLGSYLLNLHLQVSFVLPFVLYFIGSLFFGLLGGIIAMTTSNVGQANSFSQMLFLALAFASPILYSESRLSGLYVEIMHYMPTVILSSGIHCTLFGTRGNLWALMLLFLYTLFTWLMIFLSRLDWSGKELRR